MKKLLLIVTLSLLWSSLVNATTYAVRFTDGYLLPGKTIAITKGYFLADEIWNIKGTCTAALSYSTLKITNGKTLITADMTVALSKNSLLSDKNICIKNPSSLPDWFNEIINNL